MSKLARPGPSRTSTPEVMQTLSWVRHHGFKPVPVIPGQKAATVKDFASPGYQPPDDETWTSRPLNVGVVCGPQASGPIDIDLDCPEAVALAPAFLPPTNAVFGRPSKVDSHYLYRQDLLGDDPMLGYSMFIDPVTKKPMLELRSGGTHQTVLPGSLHESGETVAWSSVPFPDPSRVRGPDLHKATRRLAAAILLARHCWNSGERNAVLLPLSGMLYFLDWSEDEAVHLVSQVAQYVGDKDKSRIPTLRKTYARAKSGSKVQGAASLRKALDNGALVDRLIELCGDPEVSRFMTYNERFCVVNAGGKFRVAQTDVEPGEPPIFYLKADFIDIYGTDYVTIDDKPKRVAGIWLNSPRRRACRSIDFLPGREDTGDVLNLWTGWKLQPDDKGSCQAWLELLHRVICNEDDELYRWMLNWFANILREPMQKPLTAPVVIGPQGAGKSLLFDYFGRILGKAYTTITNPEHLIGKFNSHTANTLLLHSEEALYGGEKKHRGIIKSLITDSTRMFEQKGVDARPVVNYLRLAMTSNEAHAAPAETGDRRFTILHAKKTDPALTKRVVAEMGNGGPAALFKYLLDLEYDPALVRVNVKNEALANMKMRGISGVEAWWHERLMAGVLLPDFLQWGQRPAGEKWPRMVGSVVLYQYAVNTIRGMRFVPSPQVFYDELSTLVGTKLYKGQLTFTNTSSVNGEHLPHWVTMLPGYQNSIRNLPDLDECRKAFEKRVGHAIEWPTEEAEDEKPAYQKDPTPRY